MNLALKVHGQLYSRLEHNNLVQSCFLNRIIKKQLRRVASLLVGIIEALFLGISYRTMCFRIIIIVMTLPTIA